MKIISIESFHNEYVGLVRVRTDQGDEGWGQVAPYNADITVQILHRQVAMHVLGLDAENIEAVTQTVLDREHKFQGTYLYRVLIPRFGIFAASVPAKVSIVCSVVRLTAFRCMLLVCNVKSPRKLKPNVYWP